MKLEDLETVDYLAIDSKTNSVTLAMLDDCDWSDEKVHVGLLQAKINRYLDFIESGDVYESATQSAGYKIGNTSKILVHVYFQHSPTDLGREFLHHVSRVANEANIGFSFSAVELPE